MSPKERETVVVHVTSTPWRSCSVLTGEKTVTPFIHASQNAEELHFLKFEL